MLAHALLARAATVYLKSPIKLTYEYMYMYVRPYHWKCWEILYACSIYLMSRITRSVFPIGIILSHGTFAANHLDRLPDVSH